MATSIDNFNDLKELGIDCETNDSLTDVFNKAANHLQTLLPNVDNETLLNLYGYYKQGSQGPCNIPKPSWYDMKAKAKWEAWNKLGDMSQYEAKTTYIETIKKLDPNFSVASKDKEGWVCVSILQKEENTEVGDRTIFDYVKEENCSQVLKMLQTAKREEFINKIDDDGLGLIHWASDRGSVDVLKILIDNGADVDLQDSSGQTALHYASSCGHTACIKLLLSSKARRNILDEDKLSPEDVACDDTVKELLTNFV